MEKINKLVDDYFAAWNETTPIQRFQKVSEAFTEEAAYVDPLMSSTGHEGIDAIIAAVHEQLPGHRFSRVGGVEQVNGKIRFSWTLSEPGKSVRFAGTDFGLLSPDGRLAEVTGFLDSVEASS